MSPMGHFPSRCLHAGRFLDEVKILSFAFQAQKVTPTRKRFLGLMERDLVGSYYSNISTTDGLEPTLHTSWTIYRTKSVASFFDCSWSQYGCFVEWDITTGRQKVLFVGVAQHAASLLRENICGISLCTRQTVPFIWHCLLAERSADIYDTSFWGLTYLVAGFEKEHFDRIHTGPPLQNMHDTARHLFHISGIVEVAEHTIRNLIKETDRWIAYSLDAALPHSLPWTQVKQDLRLIESDLFGCKLRLDKLTEHHRNNINLALNIAGRAVQSDGATMKTIAVLSLIYLPGTFISGIFGTNFFLLSREESGLTWTVSDNFWLYWVVTIPITLLIILWAFEYRLSDMVSVPECLRGCVPWKMLNRRRNLNRWGDTEMPL
ncbi:uncharacterized protein BDV14DRAFT_105695 [Aspergillus stella-maris]|uniref:uncharacterized protein n=1 Tax=Aspergillus stella-maris TaxID=1810926 RepID=UPI003CCDC33F